MKRGKRVGLFRRKAPVVQAVQPTSPLWRGTVSLVALCQPCNYELGREKSLIESL